MGAKVFFLDTMSVPASTISMEIGTLKNLVSPDISYNNLSGQVYVGIRISFTGVHNTMKIMGTLTLLVIFCQ